MTNELKVIASIAALSALAAFGMINQNPTPAPKPSPTVIMLTPCAQEDSTNCYWDAKARGNGKGTSFINLKGTTYYAK